MKNIFFRCDSSLYMGSGHIVRCRNLARELVKANYKIFFICNNLEGNLINELKKEFEVIVLRYCELEFSNSKKIKNPFYIDQTKDYIETLKLLKKLKINNIDWFIVDHYGIEKYWEKNLLKGIKKITFQNYQPKMFIIDDLANREHYADFLLDSSPLLEIKRKYQKLLPRKCKKLLGADYVLMSKEYELFHSNKSLRKEIKRIFLFFGGVDPKNFTCKCLKILLESKFSDIPIDVVIGTKFQYEKQLKKLVKEKLNISIYKGQKSLAPFIAKADIAFGSGGCVIWERASLYLPSFVIPIADNQKKPSQFMDKLGLIKYFNSIDELERNIHLIEYYFHRINNSFLKSNLIWDGKGISRVKNLFEKCF